MLSDWLAHTLPYLHAYAIFATFTLSAVPIDEEPADRASGFGACFRLLNKPFILICFVSIMCHVGIDVGTNTTAPKLLQEHLGLTLAEAGFATSLYFDLSHSGLFHWGFPVAQGKRTFVLYY